MNEENESLVDECEQDEADDFEPEERDMLDDGGEMDGDHESALESVYGPDNDCDGYEEREDFGDFDYPGCDD